MIEIDGREYRTERQWERIHRHVTEAGRKRGVERTWRSPSGSDSAVFFPRSATTAWKKSEIKAERKAKDEAERQKEIERIAKERAEEAARKASETMLEECVREATDTPWRVPVPVTNPWETRKERLWARAGYVLRDGVPRSAPVTIWDTKYDPDAAAKMLPDGPARGRIISVDTETTGLSSYADELLTVGIVDAETGEILWDGMYRPSRTTAWPEAQAVNGISPEMVADSPTIDQDAETIRSIIESADKVLIYNAQFDLGFLGAAGCVHDAGDLEVEDVMLEFAACYGEWSDYFGDYKWQRLTTAASVAGYKWEGSAHGAVADAKAAAAVWRWMRDGHNRQDDHNSR